MVINVNGHIPKSKNNQYCSALGYMGLAEGMAINNIPLDKIFIGSCTNSRIEDLRMAARIVKGKKVAESIKLAMVVPGSGLSLPKALRIFSIITVLKMDCYPLCSLLIK